MSAWLHEEIGRRRREIEAAAAGVLEEPVALVVSRELWPLYERFTRLRRQAQRLERPCHEALAEHKAVQRLLGDPDTTADERAVLVRLAPRLKTRAKETHKAFRRAEDRMLATQADMQAALRKRRERPGPDLPQGYTFESVQSMASDTEVTSNEAQGPAAAPEAKTGANPLEELVDRLSAERDQLKDQLLRAMAEAQNVQRRLRSQMEEDRKFAIQPLVERLLPVLDSFERSLKAASDGASFEALLEGVKAIDRQLRQALESFKVERIEAVGKPYDPVVHEALLTHTTDEHPEDTVTDEIEPGYRLHERVVRPAKVRVAKKP